LKLNLVIGLFIGLLIGTAFYAGTVLIGSWSDLFDQQAIKPYAAGSLETLPLVSVSTEGFENTGQAELYRWSADQAVESRSGKGSVSVPESGKLQYDDYCLSCHGSDNSLNNQGLADTKINEKGMVSPVLPSLTANFNDAYLYLKIENGGTAMPRLGHIIIAADRWLIIDYLRTLESNN
jgi:mono/diheme cytochrome c family protein